MKEEGTYEFYREQTLLLTEEYKELKDTKEHLEEYVHKQEEENKKLRKELEIWKKKYGNQ